MWYRAASICASNLPDWSRGRREFNCNGRRIVGPFLNHRRWQEALMKALILYVVFVVIGALVASGISLLIEREVSSTASLITFLGLFFANFAVSWILVIFAMDGGLQDAQGRQAQMEMERAARVSASAP
jgi:hypothetical protein